MQLFIVALLGLGVVAVYSALVWRHFPLWLAIALHALAGILMFVGVLWVLVMRSSTRPEDGT